jgi:hypothetical protein
MTFKEFLDFLSEGDGTHFFCFLVILVVITEFIIRIIKIIFKQKS